VASVDRTPPNPAYANDINEPNDRDFELAERESSEATRFAPHLELLPSHTGLHVADKPEGVRAADRGAPRRAAASGVAIQTLSSFAVGENALA
jgi:hypothetical protein